MTQSLIIKHQPSSSSTYKLFIILKIPTKQKKNTKDVEFSMRADSSINSIFFFEEIRKEKKI